LYVAVLGASNYTFAEVTFSQSIPDFTASTVRALEHFRGEWPPERMLSWAATFGAHVEEVVRRTMAQYPQPEMGYRPVLGIIRGAQKYGAKRMDAACLRALSVAGQSAPHRRYIEGILKRGLDHAIPQTPPVTPRSTAHEHVRGPGYRDKEEDK
jgi:transposase